MRIALTITELDPGGAERTMVQLARYLKRRSHCVEVFALGETSGKTLGVSPERTCLHEKLLQAEIPWHCGHAQGAVSLPRAVVWLKRKLAEFRPDLIQSMLFHANVVTALANRWLDLPHVGGARVAQPQWWRRRMQQWATNNHMEKLVCVSHSLAQDCTTRERIRADKIVVIPNGISVPAGESNPIHQKPQFLLQYLPGVDTTFFIFVGRLSKQKGIDLLLRRIDQLLQPLPQHHLVILGDGPLQNQVRSLIDHSACGNRIHTVGWHPNPLDWIRHAQAVLVPSIYEGMPNVILEAMSVARPVVALDVEGVSELLGESPQQIAAAGNLTQFIELAIALGKNPSRGNALGQANLDRVLREHRLEDKLALYEQLYRKILMADHGNSMLT